MKRIYILFFALPVLLLTLLYLSIWWFIAGTGAIMAFIVYRLYAERLEASESRNSVLEAEVDELHVRLEKAVLKEQKISREADQVKQLKQQLLSVLGHEIRTPMNGIMGMALLLEDTPLTKEQQEYAGTIRNCGESLLTTVNNILANDILDFSKLHQEGNQLEYREFNLRDCVEEVLDLFADKTGRSGPDLLYSIDEDVPLHVLGDAKRLRQILMNLVENAVKFTAQGEIVISMHQTHDPAATNLPWLYVEVKDSGTGIPSDQLKQLFKGIPGKDFQKDTDAGMQGLGLVVCRRLVELMGGQISVTSRMGEGSIFSFRIPFAPGVKQMNIPAQPDNLALLQGKRILVTDDNATARSLLMKQLRSWKISAEGAAEGKEALDILSAASGFDAVLMDANPDNTHSVGLAKAVREKFPLMPVILMSAPAGKELYRKEAQLFAAWIAKPVRQHVLRDQLIAVFSRPVQQSETNITNKLSAEFAQQHPLRILVAEDNTVNQKLAMRMLEKLGYKAELAANGKEVMELVGQQHYDVILMDVQMPEMDGMEATRMIRTCLDVQPVIIAMTANVMHGDRDACIQSGMNDYMSKPINLQELLNQLEKWSLTIRSKS